MYNIIMNKISCAQTYLASLATEQADERSRGLDSLSGPEIAALMNRMDGEIAAAVALAIEPVGQAIEAVAARIHRGGRLLYVGAGTSGRLGVLDASECPPTFGVDPDLVQGIIAGGDRALRHAAEGAEDDADAGKADLQARNLTATDSVVAISASGYAPYCIGALDYARSVGALAVSLCCNAGAQLSALADIAIEILTGGEALTGSTRLRAGTATKMALNMLSTGVMVRLGKVYGNLMVDMRATNSKLKDRAARIVRQALHISQGEADALLAAAQGDVKAAIVMGKTGLAFEGARSRLEAAGGMVGEAIRP